MLLPVYQTLPLHPTTVTIALNLSITFTTTYAPRKGVTIATASVAIDFITMCVKLGVFVLRGQQ